EGIFIYNPQTGNIVSAEKHFKDFMPLPLPQRSIINLIEADNETIWAGTAKGVFAVNTSSGVWKQLELRNDGGALVTPEVRKIIKDVNNNIYVAGHGDGLFYYDAAKQHFTNYNYSTRWNNSLPDNEVTDVAE